MVDLEGEAHRREEYDEAVARRADGARRVIGRA